MVKPLQHTELSRALGVLTKGCSANLAAVEMKLSGPDGRGGPQLVLPKFSEYRDWVMSDRAHAVK